jgi:NTP pyrophosphatase (non-canonical NTP hydrolase)
VDPLTKRPWLFWPADRMVISTNPRQLLAEYDERCRETDRLPPTLEPVLLGLFGEVGSVMAPAKKVHREGALYVGYVESAEEEFGDLLWYFGALCRRLDVTLIDAFSEIEFREPPILVADPLFPRASCQLPSAAIDRLLIDLGQSVAALAKVSSHQNRKTLLRDFARAYTNGLEGVELSFAKVMQRNLVKARGRFLDVDRAALPTFDSSFDPEERLPSVFEFIFTQRRSGQCYLQMNDIFIGDPLTDNIADRDDYRFHDVFHMAYAAILHWSPVIRALLKRKRKSNPTIDETQDGGRAIVVEEGVSAYVFSYAKQVDFFTDANGVPYDLLKDISRFVRGYEVEQCPLRLWEISILEGYKAFRSVRDAEGGIIRGDRRLRTVSYTSHTRV